MKPYVAIKYGWNWLKYGLNLSLQRSNREYAAFPPDLLPMPSPWLAFKSRWLFDLNDHYQSGIVGHSCVIQALSDSGFKLKRGASVLDFGCGCGRIARHFKDVNLIGADVDKEAVAWCNLYLRNPKRRFFCCGPWPAFDAEPTMFDLILAASVFTHMTGPQMRAWLDTFHGLLQPKGVLVFSMMGSSRMDQLPPRQARQLVNGHPVCVHPPLFGTNCCGSFCPHDFVTQRLLPPKWRLELFVLDGMEDHGQDLYVVRPV